MHKDYVDELIQALDRVVTPNRALLKDLLVIGGMPEPTQNMRYLSYNRHASMQGGCCCEFSAVAVINNRRAHVWQLTGTARRISRWVFSTRWTRNPLDLFVNNLRCDPEMIRVLDRAKSDYTLLGILTVSDACSSGDQCLPDHTIYPVMALPGASQAAQETIQAFEISNRIQKTGLIGFQLYRKTGASLAGSRVGL